MGMPVAVDSGHRWQMARMLVTDDTIATRDRVAGALLVLYAQPLTRIAALTTSDVHRSGQGTVTITVAERVVIELVEPFDTLILAGTIGIAPGTAAKWGAIAGGDWTRYAGRRSDRPT